MCGGVIHHRIPALRLLVAALALSLLGACDDAGSFSLKDVFTSEPNAETNAATPAQEGTVTDRDVEAPEVFSASEPGLWDGRPSLGGVWVAHPDVTEPERVIIRNQVNGQSVVGALFRRERDIPGPRLQMSSDAAEALGVLAGAPADLEVVALRKEVVALEAIPASQNASTVDSSVTESSLDPIAVATAALDASESEQSSVNQKTALPSTPEVQSNLPSSTLKKPFVQIGIFSEESNAERAAKQMRSVNLRPTIKKQEAGGKAFWRVLVGPAINTAEQKELLDTIKGEGFSDAYAVTN